MLHAKFVASRVKPSGWAHATRLVHVSRQNLLQQCALRPANNSHQSRCFQSNTRPDNLRQSAQTDQVSENTQSTELDSRDGSGLSKPVKDHSWPWKYTGKRIESINGKALKGIEEFVSHTSGSKLLCSWTVGNGNEPLIWVPGDAPRVKDVKLPMNLRAQAAVQQPSCEWTLGSPQASFEPFFASLASMNPRANLDNTDVIARSRTLQLLLGVVRGNLKQLGISNITAFQMALVQNTLIIKRLPQPRTDGTTLGRGLTPTVNGSFMNSVTEMRAAENDDEMPADHSHAVRYELAHLSCVVVTPVDAATGNVSLPPLTVPDKSLEPPQEPGSVKVKRSGRGVPPGAVTKLVTGMLSGEASDRRRLNYKGQLTIKPSGQTKIWFERPHTILQGQVERVPAGAPEDMARLVRVSARVAEPILDTMEEACQLELRQLVSLLERLRETTRRAGGSCILTCLPPEKGEPGSVKVPAKFELYKCGPDAEPMVLDWHVKRFWSKK